MKFLFCLILLAGFRLQVWADGADTLFSSDEIVYMELRTDFTLIRKGHSDSSEYISGELIYGSGSNAVKFNVKVMARGNFRRNPSNCSFPPLLVNFKKNEVKNTLFDNQDKLKLVTPCQIEEDVIQEYLIYKLYNLVTDMSLNVRLVKILYFDTGSGEALFTKYSFFIEDIDQVAERTNCIEKERFLTPFGLNRDIYIKMSLFQYMVGNKDWFVTSGHNIYILQPDDTSSVPIAVPYDFDFSAFVDAHYAKPKGVPEDFFKERRIYRGICFTPDEFEKTFRYFNFLKPSFKALIKKSKLLSFDTRLKSLEHIDFFYTVINSKELVKTEILDMCETRKLYNLPDN